MTEKSKRNFLLNSRTPFPLLLALIENEPNAIQTQRPRRSVFSLVVFAPPGIQLQQTKTAFTVIPPSYWPKLQYRINFPKLWRANTLTPFLFSIKRSLSGSDTHVTKRFRFVKSTLIFPHTVTSFSLSGTNKKLKRCLFAETF